MRKRTSESDLFVSFLLTLPSISDIFISLTDKYITIGGIFYENEQNKTHLFPRPDLHPARGGILLVCSHLQ